MIDDHVRSEMIFYATTGDYSDAERYEKFALACNLDKKAFEIGRVVRGLVGTLKVRRPVEILETASATGLTAVGVAKELTKSGIKHIYTSLDIEQNLLDYAKACGRGDKFVQGDFENLPFADESFNIYIMMGAEGCRPKGKFYAEVYRVLKSGGHYVMPQIGPRPIVSDLEKDNALKSGLTIVRADNYLICKSLDQI
ncbi:MAG: class I SAM-dependent methyltransferase [Alphaproteobacteria bacterium]